MSSINSSYARVYRDGLSQPKLPSTHLHSPWGVLQPCRRSTLHTLECIETSFHSPSCQALICTLPGECCHHVADQLFMLSSVSRRTFTAKVSSAHPHSPWGVLQPCRRSTFRTLECIDTDFHSQSCPSAHLHSPWGVLQPCHRNSSHARVYRDRLSQPKLPSAHLHSPCEMFIIEMNISQPIAQGSSAFSLGSAAPMSPIGFPTLSSAST